MEYLKQKWTDLKAWFKNSWSILIARLEVLTGILVGTLTGIDWSALANLDWSQGIKSTNAMIVAGLFVVKGLVSEIGRRAGTVQTTDGTLVPTSVVSEAKIEVK